MATVNWLLRLNTVPPQRGPRYSFALFGYMTHADLFRPRGLVLYGATRLGKTVWARSLGKHAYFGGLFNLDEFNAIDCQYAVFDDINGGFGYFPSYKQWLGGQYEFTVNDKYKHKMSVRWGKPSIWLCNTDPRLDAYKPGGRPDFEWMEENCDFVEITEPIFRASRS